MYRHDICLARSNEFKFFMLLLVSFWRNFFFLVGAMDIFDCNGKEHCIRAYG